MHVRRSLRKVLRISSHLAEYQTQRSDHLHHLSKAFNILQKYEVKLNCWNEECEAAFQGLKKYLTYLPFLSKPITGETLFLYLAVSESAISGALVHDDESIQKLVYYVSKSLTRAQPGSKG